MPTLLTVTMRCVPSTHFPCFKYHTADSKLQHHDYVASKISSKTGKTCVHSRFGVIMYKVSDITALSETVLLPLHYSTFSVVMPVPVILTVWFKHFNYDVELHHSLSHLL